MSSEFQKTTLGALVNFSNGRSSPERSDEGRFPVFGSNGLIGKSNETNAPSNSVIVGRVGSYCGSVHFSHQPCWVTDNAIKAVAKDSNDPEFLFYLLKHLDLNAWRSGSGQPLINQTTLNSIEVYVPEPGEQREIGKFVGALDDRITLLRETNATLEGIAQALFKSWFVDFDPVRAKIEGRVPDGMDEATAGLFPDAFEESELGLAPKGWSTAPIYDMATFINGAAYKAFDPNSDRRGRPIIKIAELKSGVTTQTAFSDVAMPGKYLIETGDILFSWSGNPDTSIDTFVWTFEPAWLNQHIFRVLPHAKWDRSFVLQMLRHLKPIFTELARNKQTTGLGHVTVADMKREHIAMPTAELRGQFDQVVGPVVARIFENENHAQNLTTIRDTLLPRLISGQLRVTEALEELEAA